MGSAAGRGLGLEPPRTSQQGARSILLASEDNIPNGSFSYDGKLLDWTSK
jgi:hypothetical protein